MNLANCNISDDGGEAIARSFFINHKCEALNLSGNRLGLNFAKVFEEVLKDNKMLRWLDLSHNSLYEDHAIVHILKGLQENEMLECLNLSWNALGGEPFGKILSKSIKSSKLRVLNMENNRMATFELKKLALGVKFSKTLEEVYLAGNMMLNGEDVNFINAFTSKKSVLSLMSFGRWFHLSQDAFRVCFRFRFDHLMTLSSLQLLRDIKLYKPDIEVIYKGVILPNPPRPVVMLDVLADRAKALAMKPKNKILKRDMG